MATAKTNKKVEAAELFQKADQAIDVRSPGSPPVRLVEDLSIWTREQGTIQGSYTLTWADPERWREELTLPGFHMLKIRDHQTLWRVQNRRYPTIAAVKAGSVTGTAKLPDSVQSMRVEQIREEQIAQTTAKCVKISPNVWGHSIYCFDPNQGYPLSLNTSFSSERDATDWSDYIQIGSHWIPRLTRKYENGKLTAQSQIKEASLVSPIEPALFAPPPGAEHLETCDHQTPPKPIRKPEPGYTSQARDRKVQGVVTLCVILDRQGNVEDVGIIESLDPGLDESAAQTIKNKWKFQPPSCEGNPIPIELTVEISFRLF